MTPAIMILPTIMRTTEEASKLFRILTGKEALALEPDVSAPFSRWFCHPRALEFWQVSFWQSAVL